jgi:hypothetical protein
MTKSLLFLGLTASVGVVMPAAADSPDTPVWPDTPLARLEAFALLQSLETALLSHDSATLVLDDWCARHRLAEPGTKIVAERVRGQDKAIAPAQRVLLHVGPEEPVRYRRVRLRCGALVLSEADNWYVPARLTPAMNAALDSSDISFGRVVQPLQFRRQTLSAQMLWSPLPGDWDTGAAPLPQGAGGRLAIPDRLMEHRAVLSLPDGTPFSEVVETYTGAVLAFTPPPLTR